MIKEYIKKWKLLNTQQKHINQMIKELNDYINYSKDNTEDFIEEVCDKMNNIKEFTTNL